MGTPDKDIDMENLARAHPAILRESYSLLGVAQKGLTWPFRAPIIADETLTPDRMDIDINKEDKILPPLLDGSGAGVQGASRSLYDLFNKARNNHGYAYGEIEDAQGTMRPAVMLLGEAKISEVFNKAGIRIPNNYKTALDNDRYEKKALNECFIKASNNGISVVANFEHTRERIAIAIGEEWVEKLQSAARELGWKNPDIHESEIVSQAKDLLRRVHLG